jgi:hypothetical protein
MLKSGPHLREKWKNTDAAQGGGVQRDGALFYLLREWEMAAWARLHIKVEMRIGLWGHDRGSART